MNLFKKIRGTENSLRQSTPEASFRNLIKSTLGEPYIEAAKVENKLRQVEECKADMAKIEGRIKEADDDLSSNSKRLSEIKRGMLLDGKRGVYRMLVAASGLALASVIGLAAIGMMHLRGESLASAHERQAKAASIIYVDQALAEKDMKLVGELDKIASSAPKSAKLESAWPQAIMAYVYDREYNGNLKLSGAETNELSAVTKGNFSTYISYNNQRIEDASTADSEFSGIPTFLGSLAGIGGITLFVRFNYYGPYNKKMKRNRKEHENLKRSKSRILSELDSKRSELVELERQASVLQAD